MGARSDRPYHHGDLRRVLLDYAATAVAESGVAQLSLRALARRAGVSHAAPAHHFTDRTGLLTALAAQGYEWLADELAETRKRTDSFLDVGVAYVRFAGAHPAHFDIMFQPSLYHADDPRVRAARDRASEVLYTGAATLPRPGDAATHDLGIAAWSLVHGVATLWLSGALPADGGTPDEQARRVINTLFG